MTYRNQLPGLLSDDDARRSFTQWLGADSSPSPSPARPPEPSHSSHADRFDAVYDAWRQGMDDHEQHELWTDGENLFAGSHVIASIVAGAVHVHGAAGAEHDAVLERLIERLTRDGNRDFLIGSADDGSDVLPFPAPPPIENHHATSASEPAPARAPSERRPVDQNKLPPYLRGHPRFRS